MQIRALLVAGAMVATGIAAHADILPSSYSVSVSEGLTNGNGFDTANGNPFTPGAANTASATFTYTGSLNFDNTAAQNGPGKPGDANSAFGFSAANISNYNGSGTVDYAGNNVANYNGIVKFLNSSGSSSGFDYGSYYTFDLGVLNAGTVLMVTHDDGISIFQGSTQVGNTVSGPTAVTTDTVRIANTGDTVLRYARENGTPSILQVSAVTPEPSSLALLGTGLLGVAGAVRRRFRQ